MATFTYQDLDAGREEIRLLRILPSEDIEARVVTELVHVSLDDLIPYEALSYTWGAGEQSSLIVVSGSTFPVTTNLHEALKALRLSQTPRWLWIDAICINQSSNNEKSREILRMFSIYKRAARVVVWLGPADGTTPSAIDHLSALGNGWTDRHGSQDKLSLSHMHSTARWLLAISIRSILVTVEYHWMNLVAFILVLYLRNVSNDTIEYPSARSGMLAVLVRILDFVLDVVYFLSISAAGLTLCWAYLTTWVYTRSQRLLPLNIEIALACFFGRSWFLRTWILQEIAASSDAVLCCGKYAISWTTLGKSLERMQDVVQSCVTKHPYASTGFQDAAFISVGLDIDIPEPYVSNKRSFAYLMSCFSHLEATNPRDKVYGVMGLASDLSTDAGGKIPIRFRPDYNLPVRQVFANSVRQCIEATGCLDVLRAVHDAKRTKGLPTWVPDWMSSRVPYVAGLVHWRRPFSLPGSALEQTEIAKFSSDGTVLELKGFVVGVITSHTLFSLHPKRIMLALHCWNTTAKIMRTIVRLISGQHVLETTAPRGLTDILLELGRPSVHFDSEGQAFNFYQNVTQDAERYPDRVRRSMLFPADPQSLAGYATAPGRAELQWRMCEWASSHERLAGFGKLVNTHVSARPSDLICMFFGAKVPFLVRKVADRHELIGSVSLGGSRIDGLIWREVLEGYLDGSMPLSSITLT